MYIKNCDVEKKRRSKSLKIALIIRIANEIETVWIVPYLAFSICKLDSNTLKDMEKFEMAIMQKIKKGISRLGNISTIDKRISNCYNESKMKW